MGRDPILPTFPMMKRLVLAFALVIAIGPLSGFLPMRGATHEAVDPIGETVYVTKTGEKYHRGSCGYLSKSKIAMELSEAKAGGYTPCSRCKPPR